MKPSLPVLPNHSCERSFFMDAVVGLGFLKDTILNFRFSPGKMVPMIKNVFCRWREVPTSCRPFSEIPISACSIRLRHRQIRICPRGRHEVGTSSQRKRRSPRFAIMVERFRVSDARRRPAVFPARQLGGFALLLQKNSIFWKRQTRLLQKLLVPPEQSIQSCNTIHCRAAPRNSKPSTGC